MRVSVSQYANYGKRRPPLFGGSTQHLTSIIDWNQCPDVERTADTLGGAWRIKGHRIPVQAILDNAEDCSPEEIATEIFPSVSVEVVRRILAFAGMKA